MSKKLILGKVTAPTGRIDMSSPMTVSKPNVKTDLAKTLQDFRVSVSVLLESIHDDLVKSNVHNCFNRYMVKMENLVHSLDEEIK